MQKESLNETKKTTTIKSGNKISRSISIAIIIVSMIGGILLGMISGYTFYMNSPQHECQTDSSIIVS